MHHRLREVPRKIRIGALTWRDVVERTTLRLLYRMGLLSPEVALQDTAAYLGISVSDAMVRARDARRAHKSAWYSREREREREADIRFTMRMTIICSGFLCIGGYILGTLFHTCRQAHAFWSTDVELQR